MDIEDKAHYTVKEFAAAIGYSVRHVQQLIKDRHLKAQKWQWRGPTPYRFMIPRSEAVRWGLLDKDMDNGVDSL